MRNQPSTSFRRPWRAGRATPVGFTIILNAVIRDKTLTSSEKDLLARIKSYCRDGHVQISIPRLARESGWTEEWTRKLKNSLIRKGYLSETLLYDRNGCNLASDYRVHDTPKQPQSNQQDIRPPLNCSSALVITNIQKAENIKPPAGARVESSPAPTKPRTRHIEASSRIGGRFCDERGIRNFQRQPFIQRIEDRLNAGEAEEAIVADLDREYRARQAAADRPHRSTWRRRDDNLARINAACVYRAPETPEELAAEQERQETAKRNQRINLAMGSARLREESLRHGDCTQADIDEGFRLVAQEGLRCAM